MKLSLLTKALLSALASTLMLLLVFLYTQGGFSGASVGALKQVLLPGGLGEFTWTNRSDMAYVSNEANDDSYYDNDKSEGAVLGDSTSSGHSQGSSSSSPASPYNSTISSTPSTLHPSPSVIDFSRLSISEYELNALIAQQLTNLASIGLLGSGQASSSSSSVSSAPSTLNPSPSLPAPVITYIQPAPSQNFAGASLLSATDLSSKNFTTATANITDTATIKTLSVTDNASVGGNLSVTGDTTVNGDITITGNITGNVIGTINPNFTLGSIPFQGATNLTEDNSNLFWDNTNKRLGVGTSAPLTPLDVRGSVGAIQADNLSLDFVRSNAFLRFAGFNLGYVNFSGTEDAYGTTKIGAQINSQTEGDGGHFWSDVAPANLIFNTTPNVGGGTLTERMRITAAGNVGVGTSAPSSLVHVKGTDHTRLTVESPAGYLAGITLQPSGTFASSGTWTVDARGTYDAANNRFAVSNIGSGEVFTVLSNGNVGIGTTSPIARLHIEGTAAPYTPYIVLNDNSSVMSGINFRDGGISEWSIVRNDSGNSIQIIEEGVGARTTFAEGGECRYWYHNSSWKVSGKRKWYYYWCGHSDTKF